MYVYKLNSEDFDSVMIRDSITCVYEQLYFKNSMCVKKDLVQYIIADGKLLGCNTAIDDILLLPMKYMGKDINFITSNAFDKVKVKTILMPYKGYVTIEEPAIKTYEEIIVHGKVLKSEIHENMICVGDIIEDI